MCEFSGQAPFSKEQNQQLSSGNWKCTYPIAVGVCSVSGKILLDEFIIMSYLMSKSTKCGKLRFNAGFNWIKLSCVLKQQCEQNLTLYLL